MHPAISTMPDARKADRDLAFKVENLSFVYFEANEYAIRNISLEIRKGDFVGILGPSRAGKTTLCLALTGLIPHDVVGDMEGTVWLNGIDTATMPVHELSKNYGFVFDNPEYQLSQATVEEEVALGLENRGVDPDQMRAIIDDVLHIMGLDGYQKRSPFELSGGQQQRLAIATMLVSRPSILILDEPTSFLDPRGKQEVYEALRLLNQQGLTIVLVDHEVELMAQVVKKMYIMYKGEIRMSGTPSEVFRNVEGLEEIGLRVPQSAEVVVKAVPNYPRVPLTVDDALGIIEARIKRNEKGSER
ncbi:MAG: ATP-binding cassette domain-containing protein [Conexivisphaerales archaeon]